MYIAVLFPVGVLAGSVEPYLLMPVNSMRNPVSTVAPSLVNITVICELLTMKLVLFHTSLRDPVRCIHSSELLLNFCTSFPINTKSESNWTRNVMTFTRTSETFDDDRIFQI